MATKLYVGNLSFQTSSEDLRAHFAQAGTVESASVVEDRMTGRSRGFGFVEMPDATEAQAAVVYLIAADNSTGLRIEYNAPFHHQGRGARHDSASLLLSTGGAGPAVAVYPAACRLAQPRHRVTSEASRT